MIDKPQNYIVVATIQTLDKRVKRVATTIASGTALYKLKALAKAIELKLDCRVSKLVMYPNLRFDNDLKEMLKNVKH